MTNKTIYNNYSLGALISNTSGSILFKILGKVIGKLPDPYKVR